MAASCQEQATVRRECSGNENEKAVLSTAGGKEQAGPGSAPSQTLSIKEPHPMKPIQCETLNNWSPIPKHRALLPKSSLIY